MSEHFCNASQCATTQRLRTVCPFPCPVQVSIDEFVSYFTDRVKQALTERKRKRSEKALVMLRKTFAGAMSKGRC
jgi:hypothetical protein